MIGRCGISLNGKGKRKKSTATNPWKSFSKTSQKSHWNDASQKGSFSNYAYLFPNSVFFKINSHWSEPRLLQSTIFNKEMKGYLTLLWSNSGTFFDTTIALRGDAAIDCLIKWVQLTTAVDHSPALNCPCLRVWTQLTYFLSFSTSSVFSLPFAMSGIFYFSQCPKRKGVGSIISERPS